MARPPGLASPAPATDVQDDYSFNLWQLNQLSVQFHLINKIQIISMVNILSIYMYIYKIVIKTICISNYYFYDVLINPYTFQAVVTLIFLCKFLHSFSKTSLVP